ncbi:hypothetical protein DX873_17485 [Flagellimonas nanhaiensis]|uniref:Uncharacterized protein n=1 Tax=Flagellimonas nanhaiensis TaxID=2292706 RepID=A0A371JLW3_9FLAO|nr:hypothetical protein DX873_17485 [Allomuricauda nanhaiensis]
MFGTVGFILRGVCLISSVRSTMEKVGFVKTFGNKSGGGPRRGFYHRAKIKEVETLFVPKTRTVLTSSMMVLEILTNPFARECTGS